MISNIHYLDLHDDDRSQLERAASLYASNANITFKIVKTGESLLVIEARQGKNKTGTYQDAKGLVDRGKDLFEKFYPNHTIRVGAKPYAPPAIDVVTPEWIESQMSKHSIRIKDIEKDTGLDKGNLSSWINGTREMGRPTQAMFYFMLSGDIKHKK